MTTQVGKIYSHEETNTQNSDLNRFLACEEIVEELVEQGLPSSFVSEIYISRISKTYGISFQEAKTCLNLARKQLETEKPQTAPQQEEKMYAQSGYFYPQSNNCSKTTTRPKDGMDSLSSLGAYNRLMFGLR